MSFEIILVLVVILFLLVALYREWLWPPVLFFISIVVLTLAGIISPKEALGGFANDQVAVIVILLILSEIIRHSSLVDKMFDRIFKGAKSVNGFLIRMMAYVSVSSAFFNNTPLVAMMMPYVHAWSNKNNISPSRLLIPLSYAAILGGCMTLVGTSTNLIVNGMAIESGLDGLNVFDFIYVGAPMLVIGFFYLLLFGKRLLPDTPDVVEEFVQSAREYLVEVKVNKDSPLIGKSIMEAKLRHLEGLFLVEIIRGEKLITPVSPREVLQAGDGLIFTGVTSAIKDLENMGLSLPKASEIPDSGKSIIELVISHNSRLIGSKIQDSDFRAKYDGSILAVHRNREHLSGKIGMIEIRAGDVLLVLIGPDFYKRVAEVQAFYVISKKQETTDIEPWKLTIMIGGIIGAVVLQAVGVFPLFYSLFTLLGVVLVMDMIPFSIIRKGFDFNLVILLAFGLAFGKAMMNSGAADYLAALILQLAEPLGFTGLIAGIFLITNLLSSYITNKAAVAILFPISMTIATTMGFDIKPFILVVCYGAAASFITPIGYQTNLMVYGPGGYSFKDFFRIGLPLTIIYMVVCVMVLHYLYN
ncbi:MAG: SLC13 family permease [Flavobacteriales bacterium]|nr:SLC13 family permease [Flavobacteriales bacterium]